MQPPFTLDGYRDTIRGLVSRGYSISDFHSVEAASQHLLLRHDIDQSIPRAYEMAKLESAERWRATYFVLMRTEMYNPWSRRGMRDLRDIVAMGHEVGLHLDATCYGNDADLEAGAAAECRLLEDILGSRVELISFHRPSKERLGGETKVADRLHTYMDRFTKSIGYSSDSRGEWRHGHPWDHEAVRAGRALQLLTHAVWWVGPNGQTPHQRLADVLAECSQNIDAELSANNDVWRSG